MKCSVLVSILALAGVRGATAGESNPLGKVIELMDSLAAKLVADGDAEDKAFHRYVEWCDETTSNQKYDIDTATTKSSELGATIAKATSDIEAAEGKIGDLAGKIAKAEGELNDAALIRKKEAAEFSAGEAELTDTLSALSRAIDLISKEMAKNPAAFVQMDVSGVAGLVTALSTIVDAVSLGGADKDRLVAFAQEQRDAAESDESGAPDPAAYRSHSKGILDVLEDLKAKAEEQLATLRKEESSTQHNYALLKQSLEDEVAYNTKELKEEKAFKSDTEEAKATATADLATTTKLLKDTEAARSATQADCMKLATDHDVSTAGRTAELKTIAAAKKALVETSSGAVEQTYSFIQKVSSSLRTGADLKGAEVARFVKRLAKDHHSEALAQLASRITALMQYGSGAGADPFVKVKGLITDMIEKLQAEADAAATEKAYCDEQIAKTEAKKSELEDDIAKLTSKIDTKSAHSAKLKEEVKTLQTELASLAKEQAEMDQIRSDQHADYLQAKADLELGLEGVGKALSILRKYYQGDGAAMLQSQQPAKPVFHSKVVESDFAKNLADEEATEADALSSYDARTQEIKVSMATKSQDVKYKVQEFKGLDKDVNELSADRTSTNEELSSVLEYFAQVNQRCIAKPETYEERKARREAEIQGLKEALAILSDETAASLLQARKHRSLRQGALTA
ncbi:unnamed protein product [Prorocentrum cordatum]|nr:unnamed protein product [Polarella glacialis]